MTNQTPRSSVSLNEADLKALTDLAARLGYFRRTNGVDVPDRTGMMRAIARGELAVIPRPYFEELAMVMRNAIERGELAVLPSKTLEEWYNAGILEQEG